MKRLFKKNFINILIGFFIICHSTAAFSAAPAIVNLVFDASGSVSETDFHLANQIASEFAELLYQRSQVRIGERSDWLSVNWFGGAKNNQDYEIYPFFNCSDRSRLVYLSNTLQEKQHPKYGQTAIYNAILIGSAHVAQQSFMLPGDYLKVVILVTDGEDNDSSIYDKNSVKQLFPNDQIFLFVVGVGNGAKVDAFKPYAISVSQIDSFNELLATLTIFLEFIP